MRPKADVERAIRHFEDAAKYAHEIGDLEHEAVMQSMIAMLKWTTGDDTTPFTALVMDPCDQVDRARRQ